MIGRIRFSQRRLRGDLSESVQISLKYLAIQRQSRKLPFPFYVYKPGRLKLFDVVGERGRTYCMRFLQCTATKLTLMRPQLSKDLVSTRFG